MKRIFQISLWILTLGGVFVLLGFVGNSQQSLKFTKLDIHVDTSNGMFFLDEKKVREYIHDHGDSIVNHKVEDVDLGKVEHSLMNLAVVKDAQVYRRINGEAVINIKQRRPIVRLLGKRGNSCYLDTHGNKMPLSPDFTPRVLVFTGQFDVPKSLGGWEKDTTTALKEDIMDMARFIETNEFWQAQIQQVDIDKRGFAELITRVGDHRILFGKMESIPEKFEKLFIFYNQGLSNTGWNKYDTIDLKYKDQVVCKKR